MRGWFGAALLALWLLPGFTARAQDAAAAPGRIELAGVGVAPATLTRETLAGFPSVEADIAFQISEEESKGRYKGVLLWNLLEKAGLTRGGDKHAALRRTFVVTGRDGYAIAFSVGEIAPDFGNTPAMLAIERDGRALPPGGGLRLIVPGDRRGARNVRDVVRIELR